MARGRRIALIAASAALALGSLAVAGCGDDDDEGYGYLRRRGREPVRRHPHRRLVDRRPALLGRRRGVRRRERRREHHGRHVGHGRRLRALLRRRDRHLRRLARHQGRRDRRLRDGRGHLPGAAGRLRRHHHRHRQGRRRRLGRHHASTSSRRSGRPTRRSRTGATSRGGSFTDAPLTLAGPGSQSGTYDFFNEEVLGEDAAGEVITPRQDYTASEDDNVIVRAVQSAEAGLGYFGFTYYEENVDTLKAFSVDGVEPSAETITAGDYPLSRPLFIYVKDEALAASRGRRLRALLPRERRPLAEDAQFVPAPQDVAGRGPRQAAGRVGSRPWGPPTGHRHPDPAVLRRRRRRPLEQGILLLLAAATTISIFVTIGIVYTLLDEGIPFFTDGDVSLWEFLSGTTWQPVNDAFGVLPLLVASLYIAGIAGARRRPARPRVGDLPVRVRPRGRPAGGEAGARAPGRHADDRARLLRPGVADPAAPEPRRRREDPALQRPRARGSSWAS